MDGTFCTREGVKTPMEMEGTTEFKTEFTPKWYLIGFPKSGLHWLTLLMRSLAIPLQSDDGKYGKPWASTFTKNCWSNEELPLACTTYRVGRLRGGHYLKAHAGYKHDLERFLWYLGACVVFIYRDFRDVAVSQAYHILSEDERLAHPKKELYRAMDSFEDVLRAVIVGIDEFPGVMERWERYAGWLDVPWIVKVRFEDLKEDAQAVALDLIRYGVERISGVFGLPARVTKENLAIMSETMVEVSSQTDLSPTFRKGEVGGWREHFTPEMEELFMRTDENGWLERLGYE